MWITVPRMLFGDDFEAWFLCYQNAGDATAMKATQAWEIIRLHLSINVIKYRSC